MLRPFTSIDRSRDHFFEQDALVTGECVAYAWPYNDVSTALIEGEKSYNFRFEVVDKMPLIAAPFAKNPSIRLLSQPIPTTHKSSINMAQAKVLTSFASALSHYTSPLHY